MYLDFFQLNEFPFNVTPDPRFLFFSERHREAFDSLLYGVEHRKGFIILTGEVGCGKTTICRSVLNNLPGTTHSAFILNPSLTAAQLVRAILIDLHIEPKGGDKLVHIAQLNRFLLDCLERAENVAVIIDESQNLEPQLMEQVRMLSNLETDQHKLMQIILSGQPELKARLKKTELRQLRQRVMVHCDLAPLSLVETTLYIQHRLKVAGSANPASIFDSAAIQQIYTSTEGIPRQINTVCDRSLLAAYVRRSYQVTPPDVAHALAELSSLIGSME
jgi:general secretion pathway protein A